jgi:hypothetical protein
MFMQDATRFVPHPIAQLADAGPAATRAGLAADTWVETETGWRQTGQLRRGDRLHTFDGGLRAIVALDRCWIRPGPQGHVLQHLLIDTWEETGLDGAVAALIPASALGGLGGIGWRSVTAPIAVVTPVFEEEEVIHASGGVLLHCPGAVSGPDGMLQTTFYPRLPADQAQTVMRPRLAA